MSRRHFVSCSSCLLFSGPLECSAASTDASTTTPEVIPCRQRWAVLTLRLPLRKKQNPGLPNPRTDHPNLPSLKDPHPGTLRCNKIWTAYFLTCQALPTLTPPSALIYPVALRACTISIPAIPPTCRPTYPLECLNDMPLFPLCLTALTFLQDPDTIEVLP